MEAFTLRQWEKSDIHSLAEYLDNRKIWDNCRDSLPHPYTVKDAEMFVQFTSSKEGKYNYCIEVNNEAAGNISFTKGTDVERYNAELGYWLAEPHWNKGIMTRALEDAIKAAFHHTDIIRIYAVVYENNPASMRVLEKTGFRKCGIHRKACFKNGEFIDCHYYELLKIGVWQEHNDLQKNDRLL